jgi:DNA-directed RNA polymerase subunit RPC12/RpoP
MEDYEYIECEECGWSGLSEELVCSEEDADSDKDVSEIKYNVCPSCGNVDCFEDIEEDD